MCYGHVRAKHHQPVLQDCVLQIHHTCAVLDPSLTQELKAAKMQYRSAFDSLREQRSAMDALSLSLAEAKRELLMEFDKWLPTAVRVCVCVCV